MAFGSSSLDQMLEEAAPLLPCLAVHLQTLQPRLQAAMQYRREATELTARAVVIAAAMARTCHRKMCAGMNGCCQLCVVSKLPRACFQRWHR